MAHHHHEPGAHPVTVSPSILRLSAWERLAKREQAGDGDGLLVAHHG